jgi:hypothetical protein
MQKKSAKYLLLSIFILTLATRLIIAFTIPNLTYDSYFHVRQVEHITTTGIPIYEDNLSYGGRETFFLPVFHYLAAFFNIFLPIDLVTKLLPNILIASLTIIIYLISQRITKSKHASLFSAFIAGYLPIMYQTNHFSPNSLALPLIFLSIYAFLNIEKKKFLYLYLLSFLVVSLTSSAVSLLLIGLIFYILLSLLEKRRTRKAEIELIIFSLFFFLWIQFLFFKNTLINEGLSFIWQNVPSQIILEYFPNFSIVEVILLIGAIPVLFGIYFIYKSLFKINKPRTYLLISFFLSTGILSWLGLIQFNLALTFVGLILAILFSLSYQSIEDYFYKTKFTKLKKYLPFLTIIILATSTIIPSYNFAMNQNTPSNEEIEAFQWLNENTPQNSKVAASLEEGHLITYYGQRKNMIDDQFTLIEDIEERFNDLNSIFITKFETHALDIFNKYDTDYIVFTTSSKDKLHLRRPGYIHGECFDKVYDNETRVYQIKCKVQQTDE